MQNIVIMIGVIGAVLFISAFLIKKPAQRLRLFSGMIVIMLFAAFATGMVAVPSFSVASVISDSNSYIVKDDAGGVHYSGTDASTAIQTAVNDLTPNRIDKGQVNLVGNFVLSSKITVKSNTLIEAAGATITWSGASQGNMLYASGASNIEIAGGTWDKNSVSYEAMVFESCTDVLLRDAHVINAAYDAVTFNKCDRVTVSNCEIDHVGHSALVLGQTSDSLVENCHFHDCTAGGGCYFLCDHGISNGVSSNNVMRGNLVERTYLSGLSLASLRESSDVGTNNLAEQNTLIDCGLDGVHYGMACGWSEGGVSNKATHCTVQNNLIYTSSASAQVGGGMYLTGDDSTVTNNIIRNPVDFGIGVIGNRNTISYNTISGVVTASYPGITFKDSSNNEIAHNTITHCPYGVMLYGASSNNHVDANHFETIAYQMSYIHDSTCVGNIIESNTYQGSWTSYNAGTGTIIRNNVVG